MKHAYLIIAHSNFAILKVLLSLLDHSTNDIFIHIDKKVSNFNFSDFDKIIHKSNLYFIRERVDVRWGDLSQVKTEYLLFEEALKKGPYLYYHLLSGVDLPIKSQEFIHDFFYRNKGKEFVGFSNGKFHLDDLETKTKHYYLFTSCLRPVNFRQHLLRIPRRITLNLQIFLGYKRTYDMELKKGSQWVSITQSLVVFLIENKAKVLKIFKNTVCPDEMFIQTLVWNSQFKNHVYAIENEYKSCLRKIDWTRGEPYNWTIKEQDELSQSNKIFARKFNEENFEIIDSIYTRLKR